MPDHIHLVAAFPPQEEMRRVVAGWKHFAAHAAGIRWQRDFFDHRVRNGDNIDEKLAYIRMNPVRAGLVACPSQWAYIWMPTDTVAAPE